MDVARISNQFNDKRNDEQPSISRTDQINSLIAKINEIYTEDTPSVFPGKKIEKTFNDINGPLAGSLTDAKQSLTRQAENLSRGVTNNLAIEHLQNQIALLTAIHNSKQRLLENYVVVMGSIDVSLTTDIYDAVLGRLTSVTGKIQELIDSIFKGAGMVSEEEAARHNNMIKNEGLILQTFLVKQNKTHITYNALSIPPCYTQLYVDEANNQERININYLKQVIIFVNTLRDYTKTLEEIQQAATNLETSKIRWQNQLQSNENIGKFIKEIQNLLENTQNATADLKKSKDGWQSPLRSDEKIRESDKEINTKEIEIRVFKERLDHLRMLQQHLYHNGELLSQEELKSYQSQYQNILDLHIITIESVDNTPVEKVEKLFSLEYCAGFIKTAIPDRTYKYSWDKSTEIISVKRDKSDINKLDLIDEKLGNWNRGNFHNIADKLKYRFMAMRLTLLIKPVKELHTDVQSPFPEMMIAKIFSDIKTPLLQSLDQKKRNVIQLADNIAVEFTKNLNHTENKPLSNQQITGHSNSMLVLQQQIMLLITVNEHAQKMLSGYVTAALVVDVRQTESIYSAILARLTSVTRKIQKFIDSETISIEETVRYNNLIQNEVSIIEAFINPEVDLHKICTTLSKPPRYSCFEDADILQKLNHQTDSSYSRHFFAFTITLLDDTQTLENIQQAAHDLTAIRDGWQIQIEKAEEIGKLLQKIDQKINCCSVLIKYVDRLRELQQGLYNYGEFLNVDEFMHCQSEHQHIIGASTLNNDIGDFLKNLPGIVPNRPINDTDAFLNKPFPVNTTYNGEMQSRILHLTLLKKMCHYEESLASHTLQLIGTWVSDHKFAIEKWIQSEEFSLTRSHEPIPKDLDYPRWVDNQSEFKEKTQTIHSTLWEAKYQQLRNLELLEERGQALESLAGNTEALEVSAKNLRERAEEFKNNFTLTGQIFNALKLTPTKEKPDNTTSPKTKKTVLAKRQVSDQDNVGYSSNTNLAEFGLF